MWFWRRMEKIIWADRVKHELLHRVKEERDILNAIKGMRSGLITTYAGTAFQNS